MEALMNDIQGQVPSYTPLGPTGFGKDIIFGSMGRDTEPMRANINITNNRRNRSMGYGTRSQMFKRAGHTEGSGFFDTILDIGKKVVPQLLSWVKNSPVASIAKKIIPQIPDILENASGNPDMDPMIKKLLSLTQDPEIKRLIQELTSGYDSSYGNTSTNYF